MRVTAVQHTGPIVRALAQALGQDLPVSVELPHLHHDVDRFVEGASLRLRLMQFSVYARGVRPASSSMLAAPGLIGRERERGD